MAEARIPSGEAVAKRCKEIANRALELMAEFQVLDMEINQMLNSEAARLGLTDIAESYDFSTNEFVLKSNVPNLDTLEGRKQLAEALGVDEVGFSLAKGDGQQ